MRSILQTTMIFGACACILWCGGRALAADDDYEPIKAGSFFLTPKLMLEQKYDTNIYNTDGHEKSDFVTAAKPSLLIQKSIRDHEFSWESSVDAERYWKNSDENVVNYKSELAGRIVAKRILTLPFKLSYALDHKDRLHERTADLAREPTRFKTLKTEIGTDYAPGRLNVGVYTGYNTYRYDNGESFTGAKVVHSDGDYNSFYGRTVLRYTTRTDITPFISLKIAQNDFERRTWDGVGFNGAARDNRLVQAMAGAEFKYHDILKGDASVGHDWRNYKYAGVKDIAALSSASHIEWMPFLKTKLSLDFSRQSEEDNIVNDGTVVTYLSTGLNYELQHDLFLDLNGEWERTKFEESGRLDNVYGGSIGFRYAINRKLEAGASYLYRWRSSSQDDADFNENVFMLRLTGKF